MKGIFCMFLHVKEERFCCLKNIKKLLDKKYIVWFLAAAVFLVLLGMLFFSKENTQTMFIESSQLSADVGEFDSEKNGFYISGGTAAATFTRTPGLDLAPGVYRIRVSYQTDTDTNTCFLETQDVSYGALLSNVNVLYTGTDYIEFYIYCFEQMEGLEICTAYSGTGELLIRDITVTKTNMLGRSILLVVFLVLVFVGIVSAYLRKNNNGENRLIVLALLFTVVFAGFPLLTNYLISNADLFYHLMRIEGIKDGLLQGQFPVRIQPEWIAGHGYADAVMYPNLLLYIPAFFRIVGLPMQTAYKLFMFLVNGATCLISFACYRRMSGNKWIGLLCAFLSTCSVYRIYDVYSISAIGEISATIWIPVICLSIYKIFTEDIQERKYKNNWILFTIGLTGIIQSHILSCEMIGIFLLMVCIVCIKKIFRKPTFFVFVKTGIATLLLNVWFLVPFVDYFLNENLVIRNVAARKIQARGLYPAHYFLSFFRAGSGSIFENTGMKNVYSQGIGVALSIALIGFLCLYFVKKEERKKPLVKAGLLVSVLAMAGIWMSTCYFPWDSLQKANGILGVLISSLQFPTRFLLIVTALLIVLVCLLCTWLMKCDITPAVKKSFFVVLPTVAVVTSMYLLSDVAYTGNFNRLYDAGDIGVGYVAGGEYLPYGTEVSQLMFHGPLQDEKVEITEYWKDGLQIEVTCVNYHDGESYIDLPLLRYKGYVARDVYTEQPLEVTYGNNNLVRVVLPANYTGSFVVEFQSPWYWRVAEGISLLTIFGLTIYAVFDWTKKKRKAEEPLNLE